MKRNISTYIFINGVMKIGLLFSESIGGKYH